MYKLQLYPGIDCFTNFRVHVLQILVQSAFYKFESSPRFTNLSPVRVLQILVQSAFYKFESSPRFTNPVQSAFYNMPKYMRRKQSCASHAHAQKHDSHEFCRSKISRDTGNQTPLPRARIPMPNELSKERGAASN